MPLRPRGIFIAAVALAAFAAGVVRADLAALFCGSSLLLASAWASAGCLLARRLLVRRSRAGPGFLAVTLPGSVAGPAAAAEALVSADLPRAFPPGVAVRISIEPA